MGRPGLAHHLQCWACSKTHRSPFLGSGKMRTLRPGETQASRQGLPVLGQSVLPEPSTGFSWSEERRAGLSRTHDWNRNVFNDSLIPGMLKCYHVSKWEKGPGRTLTTAQSLGTRGFKLTFQTSTGHSHPSVALCSLKAHRFPFTSRHSSFSSCNYFIYIYNYYLYM